MLRTGTPQTTYAAFEGNQIHFYRNACVDVNGTKEGGYFYDLDRAIRQARRFVFIADWSFHPMVCLVRDPEKLRKQGRDRFMNEDTVGYLLAQIAKDNKNMLVGIHTWNHTEAGARDTPNDDGDQWLDRLAGGKRPSNLMWRASSRTAFGMSHHQKFVVLDAPSDPKQPESCQRIVKAFFGGIDITKGRFDNFEHYYLPDSSTSAYRIPTTIGWKKDDGSPQSRTFNEWYNAEFYSLEPDDAPTLNPDLPRETWHDVHAVIAGPTAWDVVREFVGRWNKREGHYINGNQDDESVKRMMDFYADLLEDGNILQQDEGGLKDKDAGWKAQVLRSIEKAHWGPPPDDMKVRPIALNRFKWPLSERFERSIQDAYIGAILAADRFIYIETQYLIGSGDQWGGSVSGNTITNGIPEAIVKRTIQKIERDADFHTYIVMPMFPEGAPVAQAGQGVPDWQRYFEFQTMMWMASQIQKAARARRRSWTQYLTFLFPARWEQIAQVTVTGARDARVRANRRYPVYVHSKWLVVDDRVAILGSANLNERSLAGDRDTEICILMRAQNAVAVERLKYFRKLLWTEHLRSVATPAFKKLLEKWTGSTPELATDADQIWDKPESLECVKAVTEIALRNYLYFRRGLQVVVTSVDPGKDRQAFWQEGQLVLFPFDFVDKTGAPSRDSEEFDVLRTDRFDWVMRQADIRSTDMITPATIKTEVGLLLKRKVDDGDQSLPDPGTDSQPTAEKAPRWQWKCPLPGTAITAIGYEASRLAE